MQSSHPLLAEIENAGNILGQLSPNDPTFRAMLVELFHGETTSLAVRKWLPSASQQVATLVSEIETLRAEVAELRARPAVEVVESVAAPVEDITGWKRPPVLHDVNYEGAG